MSDFGDVLIGVAIVFGNATLIVTLAANMNRILGR